MSARLNWVAAGISQVQPAQLDQRGRRLLTCLELVGQPAIVTARADPDRFTRSRRGSGGRCSPLTAPSRSWTARGDRRLPRCHAGDREAIRR
jgi:hypothetical protein